MVFYNQVHGNGKIHTLERPIYVVPCLQPLWPVMKDLNLLFFIYFFTVFYINKIFIRIKVHVRVRILKPLPNLK